ncbi:MAG: NFACT family protein, partial [Candidatus Kapabacteria bacterium]|nr:NFACT family protein [Candidatus Kapabacteria bacterium]MDW7996612.1 hypothetical protein [Bacteroidota bacterium]
MVAHRETLRRLVAELSSQLPFAIEALRYCGRHRLFLWIRLPSGESWVVEVYLRPGLATFFRRPDLWGDPPRQTVPWAKEIWGKHVQSIELHATERCVRYSLDSGEQLLLFLFGTAHSGALLFAPNGDLRGWIGGSPKVLVEFWHRAERMRPSWQDFPPETPLVRALAQCYHQLGTFYSRELCYRCGLPSGTLLGSLSETERSLVEIQLHSLCEELVRSREAFLLRRPDGPPLLSLLPLQEFPHTIAKFSNVHAAVAER